jgi:hypothetical protein
MFSEVSQLVKGRLRSINNGPFIICLVLPLLNDFYLKSIFHNALTGKISDFCGLYVFATFWSALLPAQKLRIYFSTALLFIIWKSSYSEIFIAFFSRTFYPINRTVDITDLVALAILPFGFFWIDAKRFKLRTNPYLLAAISLFAFCATSIPEASQKFDQPQYVLFNSGIEFSDGDYPSVYQVYRLDTLTVVGVRELRIDQRPPIDDEFHKKQILSDLDIRLLIEAQSQKGMTGGRSYYESIKDSLTFRGKTAVTLKLDSVTDLLNFKDTRLDGKFKRLSATNQLMIEGTFKNGVEDSVWTFYNLDNEIISRKYFQDGELTRTELFENSNLVRKQDYNTRKDTVRNKYLYLVIISALVILLLTKLFLNFKRSQQIDVINISIFSAIISIIGLPFVVFILAKVILGLIPNSYSSDLFGIISEVFLVYVFTAPLFLLVLGYIKPRSYSDLIMYILVFSLMVVLVEELTYLKAIMP